MIKTLSATMGLIFLSSISADAAMCGKREPIIKVLTEDYHQRLVVVGLSEGNAMELYAASDGSWTLIYSDSKKTCIYGIGTDLETVKFVKGEDL